jgi:hypothetical protein
MSRVESTATILTDHHDWKEWIYEVQKVAQNQGVWDYIDLNKTHPKPAPQEPIEPSFEPNLDFSTQTRNLTPNSSANISQQSSETDTPSLNTRSHASQSENTGSPTQTSNPPRPSDQFARDRRAWEMDMFKHKYRLWERYDKGMKTLDTYIWEHLDKKNRVYIRKLIGVREALMKLRSVFSMTTKQERVNLVERYRQITKVPKSANPEIWAARWESVINNCIEANLPDVQDERHKEDFIRTTRNISPDFFHIWNSKLVDSLTGGDDLPDLDIILQRFLTFTKQDKLTKSTSRQPHAFGTFQGEPEVTRQPKGDDKTKSGNQQQSDPKKKRCVCETDHEWGFKNCKYYNPNIREDG